jgi:two-component system, OmpR family, response regulator
LRCLVIEDDADTSRYICNGLTELGYNVLACDNGLDGLHHAIN